MISIARKNILAGKGRFAFSVGGVAAAVLLLSFILALYHGWSDRLTAYIDETPADLWVTQKGAESFFTVSVVRDRNQEIVQNTEGVVRSSSLAGKTIRIHHNEGSWDAYLMGFQAAVEGSKVGGLGGPLRMKRGSGTPQVGEVVIDDILARNSGLDIGDEIQASTLKLKVVGISEGGNLGVTVLCFVNIADGNALLGGVPYVAYILVQTEPGKQEAVAAHIKTQNPALDVFPAATFSYNSKQVMRRTLLPVLGIVVGLIFVVGAVIVGMTMYTATMEKEREFGVMKALGAQDRRLLQVVLEQSVACSLLGFAVGETAVIGATRLATALVPQFVTLVRPSDVGLVFVASLVLSLVAAWLPVRRIQRVDPLMVFKA